MAPNRNPIDEDGAVSSQGPPGKECEPAVLRTFLRLRTIRLRPAVGKPVRLPLRPSSPDNPASTAGNERIRIERAGPAPLQWLPGRR
jgi:hypothetical protein